MTTVLLTVSQTLNSQVVIISGIIWGGTADPGAWLVAVVPKHIVLSVGTRGVASRDEIGDCVCSICFIRHVPRPAVQIIS